MTNTPQPPTLLDAPVRFTLLAILGVVGFAFGVVGLLETQANNHSPSSLLNAIYHALQLFLFDSPFFEQPVPWALQLGRFLCGLTTIAAVISVVLTMLSTSLRGVLWRLWGGHTLIIGPGRLASAVAKHAQKNGKRVILATHQAGANQWRSEVGPRLPMLVGKMDSSAFLKRCKASRAARILIVGDDDAGNLAAAAALDTFHPSREQERKVLVSNAETRASLDAGSSFLKNIEVVSFDLEERGARKFFHDHPLDFLPLPKQTFGKQANGAFLIILGWGSFAENLLLQAGRIGHFASGKKTRVLLVATQAPEEFQAILQRWPAINQVLEVTCVESSTGSPDLRKLLAAEFAKSAKQALPVTVAVCEGEQITDRLGAALWVQGLIQQPCTHIRVIPNLGFCVELGELVATDAFQKDHANLRAFVGPILEETLDLELSDSVDGLAKGLHEQYMLSRGRTRLVDTDELFRPAEKPWRNLEEAYRAASRALADHLPVKLRAIGCAVVKSKEGSGKEAIELSHEELEMLAQLEHQRWSAERLLTGWTFAPKRNDQLMHHNLLVSWEELSEADRYLDRDVVKGASKALAPLGYRIVRNP